MYDKLDVKVTIHKSNGGNADNFLIDCNGLRLLTVDGEYLIVKE